MVKIKRERKSERERANINRQRGTERNREELKVTEIDEERKLNREKMRERVRERKMEKESNKETKGKPLHLTIHPNLQTKFISYMRK